MKNNSIQVFLLVILVSSIALFSSAQLAHADATLIVPSDTSYIISGSETHIGIEIAPRGELIIESGGSLTSTGDIVNQGVITIDGIFDHTGDIFNVGLVELRCGFIVDQTSFLISPKRIINSDCNNKKELFFHDFVVEEGKTRTFPGNTIVTLTGDVTIFGKLVNNAIINNFAVITIQGGALKNNGEIKNVCANFGFAKIQGDGEFDEENITDIICLAPHAQDDFYSVDEDVTLTVDGSLILGVLANDSDADTDHSELTATSPPVSEESGTIVMNSDGTFVYTPADDFFGTDTFEYIVDDGLGGTDTATVSITVTSINDDPVANAQSVTTLEDEALAITLTGSDTDGDSLTFTTTTPTDGSLSGTAPNVTYTPNAGFLGSDSFDFTVDDENGGTDTATVSITVTPLNLRQEKLAVSNDLFEFKEFTDDKTDKRIDEAIKHIKHSLEDELWEDDFNLDTKKGKKVFDEEAKAVKELNKILKEQGKSPADGVVTLVISSAIDTLVDIDRILAQNEIDSVPTDTGDKKIDKELEKSNNEMEKADKELAKGHPDHAIKKFKKAWEHAQHALGKIEYVEDEYVEDEYVEDEYVEDDND